MLRAAAAAAISSSTMRAEIPILSEEGKPEQRGVGVQPGQLAPDFRLTALDGREIALSDLRGKRVLINSWASW